MDKRRHGNMKIPDDKILEIKEKLDHIDEEITTLVQRKKNILKENKTSIQTLRNRLIILGLWNTR